MPLFPGTKIICANPRCNAPIGKINTELNWGFRFHPDLVEYNEGQQISEKKWPQCTFCKTWWVWNGAVHTEYGWRKG